MHLLSDEELLKELAARVEEKNRALFDLRMTTQRLEEVNRRLVESEAPKGHFLSNIRNEINNPLAVIIAMAGEISAAGHGLGLSIVKALTELLGDSITGRRGQRVLLRRLSPRSSTCRRGCSTPQRPRGR